MSIINPVECIVTPVTPYFICNHFISTELQKNARGYVEVELNLKSNDLLKNQNYNDIQNFDIIQIQVEFFDFFYDEVLPIITKNDIRVIIITSQWYAPQIQQNSKTDDLLNNNHILLWISQNPIYTNNEKYMAFPYGICQQYVNEYANFLSSHDINSDKNIKLVNTYSRPHIHLPDNHIRKVYDIFGINSGNGLVSYTEFLSSILNAQFVISTSGDRDDCYRHYECIGLNAIPISNIGGGYKEIFGDNLIYSNAEEMLNMLHSNGEDLVNYIPPNRDIITISYWVDKINQRIELLKQSSGDINEWNVRINYDAPDLSI